MDDRALRTHVAELAGELDVPGVAVGVLHDEGEAFAFHGVTSVENPLPVDGATLFQFGSTGKTFTSVAVLRLVERGDVDLGAPVRTYVPELRLRDEDAAAAVTVVQLLNHTAGWDGDVFEDTGDGDDAIARFVEGMAGLQQVTPPGRIVSYNNASLALAGRVVEKVTGLTFERAMRELVLDPLGLSMTFFRADDVMTRRFAVGHRRAADGATKVLRPWRMPRSANPMGGMSATAGDQLRWARFHLDGGRAVGGEQVLAADIAARMQEPTAEMPGSALGDAVGISWLLRDVDGVRVVGHGGSTLGQYSMFEMVPSRRFAIVSLTNCGPNGPAFNDRLRKWAFAHYVGIQERDPEGELRDDAALREYAGRYETAAEVYEVTANDGGLRLQDSPKPALVEQLGPDAGIAEEPLTLRMLPGGDRYVVPSGRSEGMTGFFTRGADGRIDGVHVGGRFGPRVAG